MPQRTASEQRHQKGVRRVTIGDHDPVSRAAWHARVPLCGQEGCTRAAGHHEGTARTTGSDHVKTGIGFVALAVWL